MPEHPIRVTVADDLERSRLTVFFRLLLVLPHFFWASLFTLGAVVMAFVNWFAVLVRGQTPDSIHEFISMYVRYVTHVNAYLFLAANPYPGFTGTAGTYPVDVEIDPPAPQNRWTVAFRIVLAIPALLVASAFLGGGGSFGGARAGYYALFLGGALGAVAFLGWFACLAAGRMPQGFRDLQAYGLRYVAQVDAYLFLLTDRYPDSDPAEPAPPQEPPPHPVALLVEDDLRRSRLTTFFRALLTIPHVVWILLWSVLAFLAAIANWLVALATGVPAGPLHRFLAAYVRYSTHVSAYLYLIANPFPGFTGTPGRYPVDVELPPPERQSRWTTGFRAVLGVPALIVLSALGNLIGVVAILGWFAALATGRMPRGFRNAGAYVLRYTAQTYAYLYLVTGAYPFSGPRA